MRYTPPTLWDWLLLPFRIVYWRWFWKPMDYDAPECADCKDGHCEGCEIYKHGLP